MHNKRLIQLVFTGFFLLVLNGCGGGSSSDLDTTTTSKVSLGYVLFSTMGSTDTQLIDTNGTAVKTWSSLYGASGAAYLTDDKTLIHLGATSTAKSGSFSNGGAVGGIIEELDSEGNVLWSYTLDSDNYTFHHDFKQIDDNTIIALTWEIKTYNGIDYWNEKVIKIDKASSTIIWEWSAMEDGNLLPTSTRVDFLHFNSVDYKDSNILVSSRAKSIVYLIDENSKDITKTYTAGETLNGQHDATFLDNGNILLFNNNATTTQSKVVELDSSDNIVWEYSNTFFSDHISGVQRLENGNTFICSGVEGQFIEVSAEKEELWTYANTFTISTPKNEVLSVFKARKYESY